MQSTLENFYKTDGMMPETESIYEIDTPEEALDGIALLVSMAKSGKIDPWNIDIVDVTDKYLIQMAEKRVSNLKNTGRTIWLASVLLKLKSNVLVGLDPMDFDSVMAQDSFEEYDDGFDEDFSAEPVRKNNVVSIDEALKRRLSTRLNRKRTVTLQDLIKQLKFYEELDKKQALKNTFERAKRRARSYENFTAQDIIDFGHDEQIEKNVGKLREKLENIFIKSVRVNLEELVDIGMDRSSAYIALLFLSADSDIELCQKEFYGKLFVQKSGMQEDVVSEEMVENIGQSAKGISTCQPIIDTTNQIENDNNEFEKQDFGGIHNNVINAPPDKEAVIAS